MNDISIELLEKIKELFNLNYDQSKKVESALNLLEKGRATYADAQDYAIEVGEILANALGIITTDKLPNGKMYYNIAKKILEPTLTNNYTLISDYSKQVQSNLNQSANIGLKSIASELNQDRIHGIAWKVSQSDNFDDVKWLLNDPIIQFSQSVVDDTIQSNASLHYRTGRSPVIKRKVMGHACEWCMNLAGTYSYPDVPDNVYQRHRDCRCQVTYDPKDGSRKVQDVWSGEWNSNTKNGIDKEVLIEYSNTPTKTLKSAWRDGIDTGWMSALVNYEDYFNTYSQLYKNLVGERTKDGIEIKSISEHFMYRIFGTLIDPKIYKEQLRIVRRSGVELEKVIEALLYGDSNPVVYDKKGNPSKVYFNEKCKVSINPDTGRLIQCNPSSRKWKIKK